MTHLNFKTWVRWQGQTPEFVGINKEDNAGSLFQNLLRIPQSAQQSIKAVQAPRPLPWLYTPMQLALEVKKTLGSKAFMVPLKSHPEQRLSLASISRREGKASVHFEGVEGTESGSLGCGTKPLPGQAALHTLLSSGSSLTG
jgi:hypothetical protein